MSLRTEYLFDVLRFGLKVQDFFAGLVFRGLSKISFASFQRKRFLYWFIFFVDLLPFFQQFDVMFF
jgi:hypothetical protein